MARGDTDTVESVPVVPVSSILVRAVLEAHPLPDHPSFDGEPLTLSRLQDKAAWSNGKAQRKARQVFDRFVAEANQIQAERTDALYRLLMVRGVALEVPPVEEWAADLLETGIGEASPGTKKLLYLHHLLPEPMDKLALLVRVMEASGLESGAVDAVRGLFQEALRAANAEIANQPLPERDALAEMGAKQAA